jgi:hypothetical protein
MNDDANIFSRLHFQDYILIFYIILIFFIFHFKEPMMIFRFLDNDKLMLAGPGFVPALSELLPPRRPHRHATRLCGVYRYKLRTSTYISDFESSSRHYGAGLAIICKLKISARFFSFI